MLKKLSSITIFFFLFALGVNASDLKLTSEKYILYNLDNNNILEEQDSNDKTQIASLTKIMTIIVAIENIEDFDEKVTIKKEMLDGLTWDIAKIGFKVGEVYTYNDLLYAAILPSAADAVNALAISISGSYDKYLKLMNDKANELGLVNTHYSNVIGLTDENNYSSAYDISKLLEYSLNNKKFREIFTTKSYTLTSGKTVKATVSKYDDKYIIGSKTGYTSKAGRCLASISDVNGAHLLMVTLNNYNKDATYINETIETYKYYDENYSLKDIINKEDIITTINAKYSRNKTYNIKVDKEYYYYLENNFDKDGLIYDYSGLDEISAFDKKDKYLGTVKIYKGEQLLNEIDIKYDGSLKVNVFGIVFRIFYILLIVVFIVFLVLLKFKKIKIKRV